MNGFIALKKANDYTKESLLGGGAIVGKNVQVAKIEPIIGGNRVTFSYTLDDGTVKSSSMEVMNGEQGISVKSANVDTNNILTFELSDGSIITAGTIAIDSSKLNLDNYYTIEEIEEKFVSQEIELETLINKQITEKLDEELEAVTSDDIKSLFSK